MSITREINGVKVEIELTPEELGKAYECYVISFMQGVFMQDFNIKDEDKAEELAELAYQEYAEGDGLTEYECIEKIYDENCDE